MSGYKFKVSVVMPVYNTEKYLPEAVDSLIGQSIGFENIQLILVNDGSTDKSGEICREYLKKYPDNVVYIEQENLGVSAARNAGMKKTEGRYVNFLDSDDKWERDALRILFDFMEKNGDKTDAAAARKKLFDGGSGYHALDYKFNKTMVADLHKRFDMVQTDVTSVLIKTEAVKGMEFCTELSHGEDTRFINTILLEKNTIGIVREAVHDFRLRTDGTSALQMQDESDNYYFAVPELMHRYLFELSKKKFGRIKRFIQYVVMFDITSRLKKPVYKLLPEDKYEKYSQVITDIIKQIDDKIIYRQRSIYMNMKMYALSLKYDHDVRKDLTWSEGKIMYKDFMTIDLEQAKTLLIWDHVEIRGNILRIEGKDNCWMRGDDFNYYAKVGGEIYYPSYFYCKKFDLVTMDGPVNRGRAVVFEFHLNREKPQKISFFYRFKDKTSEIYTSLGKFSHLPKVDGGYYARDAIILTRDDKSFMSYPNTKEKREELEKAYREVLTAEGKEDIIELRKKYFELKAQQKKEVWMVSDRTYVANDNGEHFFRYLSKHHHRKIEVYFNINSDCPDYERMQKYGKVVAYDSPDYPIMFIMADKIISSTASDYLFNPFGDDKKYLTDIIHFDFIYLKHGIIKDDMSGWLNRFNKSIRLMITAAAPEYLSIVNGDYCLERDHVTLTGLARYDNLYKKSRRHKPKKKILIIPTWRKSIKGSYDQKTNKSVYYDKFKETEFFKFYNALINDPELTAAMKENGYSGVLCMHPMHSEQCRDFTGNDVFEVNEGFVDYQKEFVDDALLVTDYSSVAFDFAYLKKPVIYCQFDREDFYKKHTYSEGYFVYEENGFGPVCYDLRSTVKAIIKEISGGCENSSEYLERIEQFYPYHDAHCCKRIYESITEII